MIEETKTIWRFKNRGNGVYDTSKYPGNFSPYIPKNIILKYSISGDLVFDGFSGAGTTSLESKLLMRNSIAIDINIKAINITKKNLNALGESKTFHKASVGDSQKLTNIHDESIDLICTHPPYSNIIKYSIDTKNDLSLLSPNIFIEKMENVANEYYRILKKNKICAIVIGDLRIKGNIFPLGFSVLNCFLNAGFKSKEIVIKEQFNCSKTSFWEEKLKSRNILLINHEYIFILKK